MKQVTIYYRGFCSFSHKDSSWNSKKDKFEVIDRVLDVVTHQGVLRIVIAEDDNDEIEGTHRCIPIDRIMEWRVRL